MNDQLPDAVQHLVASARDPASRRGMAVLLCLLLAHLAGLAYGAALLAPSTAAKGFCLVLGGVTDWMLFAVLRDMRREKEKTVLAKADELLAALRGPARLPEEPECPRGCDAPMPHVHADAVDPGA